MGVGQPDCLKRSSMAWRVLYVVAPAGIPGRPRSHLLRVADGAVPTVPSSDGCPSQYLGNHGVIG